MLFPIDMRRKEEEEKKKVGDAKLAPPKLDVNNVSWDQCVQILAQLINLDTNNVFLGPMRRVCPQIFNQL